MLVLLVRMYAMLATRCDPTHHTASAIIARVSRAPVAAAAACSPLVADALARSMGAAGGSVGGSGDSDGSRGSVGGCSHLRESYRAALPTTMPPMTRSGAIGAGYSPGRASLVTASPDTQASPVSAAPDSPGTRQGPAPDTR